jgi:hypothetical protein
VAPLGEYTLKHIIIRVIKAFMRARLVRSRVRSSILSRRRAAMKLRERPSSGGSPEPQTSPR